MNLLLAAALILPALYSPAQTGVSADNDSTNRAAVTNLVERFDAAEQAYDVAALKQLLSERYIEISPAGEVDRYDRFLSFYTPDKKTEWPPLTLSVEEVRVFGDTAIEIATLNYSVPGPDGAKVTRSIRAAYTAQRQQGIWRLLGAQFTGVRPAPATPSK